MPICSKAGSGGTDSAPRIAIVGRGFTGAAAAAALLRRREGPFSLVLIDETNALGGGLAYGKARAGELLNVRARDLSLLAEDRGDFARWLLDCLNAGAPATRILNVGQIFAPRALFADYVRERLAAEILKRPDIPVQLVNGGAIGLDRRGSGYVIRFDEGDDVECDGAVLATGYGGGDRRFRFGSDPFGPFPEEAVLAAQRVALVGSGLTMVDVLLRLRRMGCSAEITIISRHGLVPQPQLKVSPQAEVWRGLPTGLAGELVSEVRRACREAVRFGDPWQGVINGLRPEAQRLWRMLPVKEQKRFLRHARAFWDIHRHRLPADIYLQMKQELDRERTVVRAGTVIDCDDGAPYTLAVRWRGQRDIQIRSADMVIDCSGHKPDLSSSLLRGLVRNGLARMDAHGVGLDVDEAGRVTGADGARNETLFALGPLGAGSLFEIAAAPEIAAQAQMMAAMLLSAPAPYVSVRSRVSAEAWS